MAWESYTPSKSHYWLYGGPWVHPDNIPPGSGHRSEDIRSHEKPVTRAKSVAAMLDEAKAKLDEAIKLYTDVHERGIDALPWEWEREKIQSGHYGPGDPNPIHWRLCHSYSDIAYLKAMIPIYESILDGLDSFHSPLFNWKSGS